MTGILFYTKNMRYLTGLHTCVDLGRMCPTPYMQAADPILYLTFPEPKSVHEIDIPARKLYSALSFRVGAFKFGARHPRN